MICKLDRGVLSKSLRASCPIKTCKKTRRPDGTTGYAGTKNLKATQPLNQKYLFWRHFRAQMLRNKCCRSYPIPFGLYILKVTPQLVKTGTGKPSATGDGRFGLEVFKRIDMQDWPEADCSASCRYVRGSKGLMVPDRWKRAFPLSM